MHTVLTVFILLFKRNKYLNQFCFCLALILLNISVNAPLLNPTTLKEDLSYNKQESIVEIIVEKVFGDENAFEEFEDLEENSINKKDFKLDFQAYLLQEKNIVFKLPKKNVSKKYLFTIKSIFQQVTSPPPKFNYC
ncbi:hypothetical protein [Mesonia phycicola]|uniref:hypothetical protein n=1 Tax=Mesonia phycicola TaxID=579105 RepID=UPI001160A4CF|nr:hypothetical protein [Mesonia phycicola]